MEDRERNVNFDQNGEPLERNASFDETSETLERKSEREEAPVWGMIPIFAIIGAFLAAVAALMPAGSGGSIMGIITLAVLIVGGGLLYFRSRQRGR